MAMIKLETVKSNQARSVMGLVGSLACAIGAGFQWGIGTAFFTFGLILWIDTVVDEVVERITKISRQ